MAQFCLTVKQSSEWDLVFRNCNGCWAVKMPKRSQSSIKNNCEMCIIKGNFPTTGSPTVTLLRLHQNNFLSSRHSLSSNDRKWTIVRCPKSLRFSCQRCLQVEQTLLMWRAVCTRFRYKIHRPLLIDDYYSFQLHIFKFQKMIRTEMTFKRFASIFIIATCCCHRCNTCVAQPIRAMKTWRHPFFHPACRRQCSSST